MRAWSSTGHRQARQPFRAGRLDIDGQRAPGEPRRRADRAGSAPSAAASSGTLSASICPAWVSGQAPSLPPSTVRFAGPVLVTVGASDPVTPVASADPIRQQMPEARTVVLAARGHGLLQSVRCAASLAAAYLRSPSSPLDASCAALAGSAPPAIGPR